MAIVGRELNPQRPGPRLFLPKETLLCLNGQEVKLFIEEVKAKEGGVGAGVDRRVHCEWLKGTRVTLLPEPSLRFYTNCLLKPELKSKNESVCVGGIYKASALGLPAESLIKWRLTFI